MPFDDSGKANAVSAHPSFEAPVTECDPGYLRALPLLRKQACGMVMFDPAAHMPEHVRSHGGPSGQSPFLPLAIAARAHPEYNLIPRPEDCHALWERYAMLEHIKAHSVKVADFARALAVKAISIGVAVNAEAVYAAGLLHDLGKTYTIAHGGNHAQLGASWVMRETGNAPIASAVMFHVHWPFEESVDDDVFMIMAIIYADKRTKHDSYVSLDERYADLVDRYAVTELLKKRIGLSLEQGKRIEAALSSRLGVNLDECIADSGRLVQRA